MAKRFSFVGQASDSRKVCANKTNLQTKLVRAILYILSVLASLTVVTLISKNLFDYICGFFVVSLQVWRSMRGIFASADAFTVAYISVISAVTICSLLVGIRLFSFIFKMCVNRIKEVRIEGKKKDDKTSSEVTND